MDVLSFRWHAKYGHFLRAEANVNALSYPLPPRTAVLGLLGAVLGLDKDTASQTLNDAQIAVGGASPQCFWHRVKLRKDPPGLLPFSVKRSQKANPEGAPEKAALIAQEWLWQPDFRVHVGLPDGAAWRADLYARIRERRWHYSPCMGLSELLAELDFLHYGPAQRLPPGRYRIDAACPAELCRLRSAEQLGVHLLQLPYSVDAARVFRHRAYYVERSGRGLPVETAAACQVGDWCLVFL